MPEIQMFPQALEIEYLRRKDAIITKAVVILAVVNSIAYPLAIWALRDSNLQFAAANAANAAKAMAQ